MRPQNSQVISDIWAIWCEATSDGRCYVNAVSAKPLGPAARGIRPRRGAFFEAGGLGGGEKAHRQPKKTRTRQGKNSASRRLIPGLLPDRQNDLRTSKNSERDNWSPPFGLEPYPCGPLWPLGANGAYGALLINPVSQLPMRSLCT